MALHTSSSTTGGWASASLNTFLNNRFYESIPVEWKQLIKQVKVSGSLGNKSKEVTTSNCYIAIPSVYELDSSYNYEPYNLEGDTIPFMTSNDTRVRKTLDGVINSYWTRSPNADYANYYFAISGDENSQGSVNGYEYSIYEKGVVLLLSI